jgi:hypothetical protein
MTFLSMIVSSQICQNKCTLKDHRILSTNLALLQPSFLGIFWGVN